MEFKGEKGRYKTTGIPQNWVTWHDYGDFGRETFGRTIQQQGWTLPSPG